jgi:hypothetical protein
MHDGVPKLSPNKDIYAPLVLLDTSEASLHESASYPTASSMQQASRVQNTSKWNIGALCYKLFISFITCL